MKRFAFAFALTAVAAAIWILAVERGEDEAPETQPATEVTVRLGEITRSTLRDYVTAYGVVRPEPEGANPAASAKIAPFLPGVVVAVDAVEGQRVAKDEVLFRLDSRAADVAVDFAARTLERQRQLLEIEGTSQQAVQDAEQQLDAARVQQMLSQVPSPLIGTVTKVNVMAGEAVDLTTVMAEVVDLDRLVVSAGVPSTELGEVALGHSVVVDPGKSSPGVTGTLDFISPRVDEQTGTAEVRVRLPSGSGLRPGQLVTVRIVSEEHRDVLAVPAQSVTRNEDGLSVVAIVDGDTAIQMPVTIGLRDNGLIEVAGDGLLADMTVVTEGAYGLPGKTRVRLAED